MELDAEVHSHSHRRGHHWVDLTLALSALALSITSIVIALQNESSMHRLVTANSWPYLEVSHGNVLDGADYLHFDLRNAGIGPATLEKLVVRYDGKVVNSAVELLQHCCAQDVELGKVGLMINSVEDHVFAARDSLSFIGLRRTEANDAVWDKLNAERFKVDIDACYSSVFGEHWITNLRNPRPRPVESCSALAGAAFAPRMYEADSH
jgi:hypothetical protein